MEKTRTITLDNTNVFARRKPNWLDKLLPIMIILALMWANLFSVVSTSGLLSSTGLVNSDRIIITLILVAVVDYAIILLVLWLYKAILATRPYYFLISDYEFSRAFKLSYFIKTVVLGLFSNALFFAPYLSIYLNIFQLVLSYAMICVLYALLYKKIEVMFRHLYYKLLFAPWFVFQAVRLILLLIFGGL